MSSRELLIHEVEKMPEALVAEALHFVRFLNTRNADVDLETALASETKLAEDWLRPEEEAAWQDL